MDKTAPGVATGDSKLPDEAIDPELAALVVAWSELPAAIRAGVVAMVKATVK